MCRSFSNEISVRASIPSCETWRRAIYVPVDDALPWERDRRWGLYDEDRQIIDAAAYYRGYGKNLVGQQTLSTLPPNLELEQAPPGRYLYGGNMISHYGHFLMSVLPRFWLGLFEDLSNYKVVFHGAGNPDGWLSHGFIRDFFEAIGLRRENFIVFKRPTIIPQIVVPRPAAEEHNFAHRVLGEWGKAAGTAVLRTTNLGRQKDAIWLSKTRLARGVQGFTNESELVDLLEAGGVQIVHPQELSFAQQVELLRSRPLVLGIAGSAFHTKILGSPAKFVSIIPGEQINSNYAVIDEGCGNPMTYLRASTRPAMSPDPRFTEAVELLNPSGVARDLLDLISGIRSSDGTDASGLGQW